MAHAEAQGPRGPGRHTRTLGSSGNDLGDSDLCKITPGAARAFSSMVSRAPESLGYPRAHTYPHMGLPASVHMALVHP